MTASSDLDALEARLSADIQAASDLAALDALRVGALGKKGEVSLKMRELGKMSPEERQVMGPALNGLKDRLNTLLETRKATLEDAAMNAALASESVDVTRPVKREAQGSLHPVAQVMEELAVIFADMGFAVAEGPDVEDDFHNFTALNFPPDHPARDTHDTFFMKAAEGETAKVLRTHTSPVQIRTMLKTKPPIRIIAPGRVYRCDWDQTHTPMFHQVEGLVIDKETHMGHLKGCLMDFVAAFFETDKVEARFRPHHFPFTEPSAEMDVRYERVGDAVKVGSGDKWMEILGCGMVHPNVIKSCGLDPEEYQGFAFGMGVDRLAMLKYGMPDLRPFFEPDARWLSHYGFSPLLQANLATGLS
ncbi:MAG: phenylalanine--tRNA ligase subunit alpha [Oceanicaulis sp.]|jgi:phenylalanyl-tRNA synthetase alpha chain|uniref:phenylalanine--tRNA ligase subunit alpha n=1 Tax=unclassified Oceanicaulis TaxID=2632123 RepID=UPI000C55391F|nr:MULTISPECIES: phenylalanine--tRNA ligase subunit alpha [unclassified Oceanicaulis]MAB69120.1 phenylalanine--tRNA ligase subunit alpha [Oceanicaulis sp.]MBC38776.1 phenylalanine--tRNA ligase subunit alpha [Oceanicaulis sp.]MBG36254.1 phenylalanine--tRNA ligase subunit alpha [Oceanicaulis sp.]HBU63690.1 phenylalanine--tRNA ligase subunit alpha [Oceanicaulis sp.]HCR95277.1 phenylalanine--tRNA ligase subunit alpha [Oceanicaulis sp.]